MGGARDPGPHQPLPVVDKQRRGVPGQQRGGSEGDVTPQADLIAIYLQHVLSDDLEATYNDLSRTEYSWQELQVRPLPPGVDPAKIESYLSDDVFQVYKIEDLKWHSIMSSNGNLDIVDVCHLCPIQHDFTN